MDKGEVIKKTNIEKTHVPDKVYAFMIQSHHMLYELLNCKDGDSVSVEVFDDVGVEHEDGSKDANQLPRCKHSSTVLGSYVAAHSTCLSFLLKRE